MSTIAPLPSPRPSLLLTRRCNNECVFCGQPEGEAVDAEVVRSLEALRAEHDELTFVGGEPTLLEALPSIVARARSLGFRGIGLQTNGRLLARAELAQRLADAGLTDVHVSIHGAEPDVHDYHTGTSSSLAQTLAGVGAARVASLVVVATTVLTRSNYRNLSTIPRLLRSRGVAAWQIAVPSPRGRAAERFDRVVPRLGLAVPFALHATRAATQLGLPTFLAGMPLCTLGPFASHRLPTSASPAQAYAPACESCAVRDRCPGLDASYVERFAGDELTPRMEAPDPSPHPLARLFVGAGELAPAGTREMPEPPRAARRRLPVLARPQPGAAEARRVQPKTGEALREIFPTLFDPKA